jgi:S-DNA-T family DNA segregation ATPase FtsK/SpoIIIE
MRLTPRAGDPYLPRHVEPVHQPGDRYMRCRLALPAVLALLALPCGTGCRLGGGSSMTSWLPGQASAVTQGEELASAPPFEGEIVKPSTKATPYPTTSTPEGYVVPGAPEAASASQVAAAAPAGPTPPVTYGMKPAEVATVAEATAPQTASTFGGAGSPAAENVAAQEGPYSPLGESSQAATVTPPPDTLTSRFASAGGTSEGAYPPEETVGIAPAAGSSFAATPPVADSANASSDAYAAAAPQASAFGQASQVPQGSASDSPVAGSRYASAGGSQFGGAAAVSEPSGFAAAPATPGAAGGSAWPPAPVEATASQPAADSEMQASTWSPPAAAGGAAAYESSERSFDVSGAGVEDSSSEPAAFDVQASQPTGEQGGLKRRPDPMYRPAGTSSYQPSAPIFSDEPAPRSPVQMATYDEPVAGVTTTSPSPYSTR